MRHLNGWLIRRRAGAALCGLLLLRAASLMAQDYPQTGVPQTGVPQTGAPVPQPQQAPVELLAPDQLDNLVAPIALYPDQLLGQVLAASTYPLEIIEAQQWLQQNRGLQGPRLIEAARQQNWDASVQALVAFPDVLTLLTSDIRWTTDLGNAFLAQQADVMNAVQGMRARAQQNGRLSSNPQQAVTVDNQDGQSAIQIQPANPQVIYVPTYNPAYVWGPPTYGAYPALGYGPGYGFLYGAGVFLGGLFSGFLSFGGWGWGLNWLAHGLFLNNLFLGHFGFGGFGRGYGYGGYGGGYGGGFAARSAWVHDPGHRLGVPYANRAVASRFNAGRSNAGFANTRSYGAQSTARSFSGSQNAARSYGGGAYGGGTYGAARSNDRGSQSYNRGGEASRGYGSYGQSYNRGSESYNRGSQSYSRGAESFSSRAAAPNYKAPKNSGQHFSNPSRGSSHFSAPKAPKGNSHSGGGGHSSGGHSGGGHSGKHK
jgi:hypothetical protein